MERIPVTNDVQEMVRIAKAIVAEKKEKYDAGLMDFVIAEVRKKMPDASEAEILEKAYESIYHYWVYGASTEEFFYYDFAHKTHEERLTYMTFRVRMLYSAHINRKDMSHLLFNKYETYEYFKEYYKREIIKCRREEDVDLFLGFAQRHPDFVVKPIDMGGGRGVHKACVAGMNEEARRAFFLELLQEGQQSKALYMRGEEGAIVLEELIDQDERMAVFNPESVNGIRMTTILRDGEPMVYESWLKVGRGGNFLTSAVFGSMDAGIDIKTGVLDTAGYTETGEVFERHPDTGVQIRGFQIPRWDEVIALAKECAKKLPFFTYVAWDFVLAKTGWCIMEVNYNGDFMWQLYRNRGMKKEFEDIIGWKFEKEYWWQGL